MTREMTGAEMVIQALADQGVEHIFGYPGGAVLPIYDALFERNDVRHILVRHEQGGAHAADGFSRATGGVGATSGKRPRLADAPSLRSGQALPGVSTICSAAKSPRLRFTMPSSL